MTRQVLAAIDDMFFASKVRSTAEALGIDIKFHRKLDSLVASVQENVPDLILVDLHNQQLSPIELATALGEKTQAGHPLLLGFFSHVATDLQRAAIEAGYDTVIPRSVFSRDLAKILAGES